MMYKLHQLIMALAILISPARIVAALPAGVSASVPAQAVAQTTVPLNIKLDTHSAQGLVAVLPPKPNFDTDVLAPLRATQAAEAQAAAQAAATKAAALAAKATVVKAQAAATDDLFAKLRYCESGGVYTKNTGNGYFGAYQYSIGSWNGYGGYARPDQAPAEVQDAKAHADQAARGWAPWPACSRMIGAA